MDTRTFAHNINTYYPRAWAARTHVYDTRDTQRALAKQFIKTKYADRTQHAIMPSVVVHLHTHVYMYYTSAYIQ